MPPNEEVRIPLTYWVDENQKRVVVAEASGDFVDVLFSFLTLPLGTIIRLGNELDQPVELGCINKLYESVHKLESNVFWNEACKKMLHSPRNPLESSCQRLKVKVDDTEPTKYFVCKNCSKKKDLLLSTFDGARCHCGELMAEKTTVLVESKEEPVRDNGVFVKTEAMFLISDYLRVLPNSTDNSVQTFLKHQYTDFSNIKSIPKDVGKEEILEILKRALISKSPLSDVFFGNKEHKKYTFSKDIGPIHSEGYVEIKVTVSKSTDRILFAEADGDFVDFLVSFLTIPIGSIMKLMKGKLCFGSIGNVYASVKDLDPSWFIGSSNEYLLNIKVAHNFGCKKNPLEEDDSPQYWYGPVRVKQHEGHTMISRKKYMLQDPIKVKLFDPRSSDGAREPAVGFMKRPCVFIVKDDLELISMTNASSVSYLEKLEVNNFNDFEKHFIKIRKSHEALDLLWASLTSNEAALTQSLFNRLWKCQRCIPFCGVLGSTSRIKKEKREKRK